LCFGMLRNDRCLTYLPRFSLMLDTLTSGDA
jgi:hypothetical protein